MASTLEDDWAEVSDECVIKQVDITVPKTDDPSLPVVTFRMWVLGLSSCVLLSFVNQFFGYRTEPLSISSVAAQIAVVPLGHLMARTITNRVFYQSTRWEFTLNPGPFNIKEHVLISIFANSGASSVYATNILSAVKLFYKKRLAFWPALIIMATTQILGYGWAGLFRQYLVEPGEMWWPGNLVQVSLFRALHDRDKNRSKGGTTRTQFFLIVFVCSFAYYIVSGYFFPLLTSFSWLCWIAPNSVFIQQIGSGLKGLGIGSFGLDWSTISSYLGSPLASPWFATANVAVGFAIVMYVVTPLIYWLDIYNAKNFPLFSNKLFTSNGSVYDVSQIVSSNFEFDENAYQKLGPINLSTFFAVTYGLGFATISSTVVHILLFHGRDLWKQSKSTFGERKMDVHSRLMKVYKQVPMGWYHIILLFNMALIFFACFYYKETLQLPWWGVLFACAIALAFTLPIGVITATTNQAPGLNIITEYIFGYVYPGRPVANMLFKTFGYISMIQALTFLADLKLGHYMKIPPRTMFMAQVVGTLVAVIVYMGTAWWLMGTITNLCDTALLPPDSQWTCPIDHVFYDASVIWGLVGPRRIFGNLGLYSMLNWFFLGGAMAPLFVWLAQKAFPNRKWIRLIHMPVLIGASAALPPATAVNYTSWIIIAFVFGFFIFRHQTKWWERHNYILSAGLDAGTAFMSVLIFIGLQMQNIQVDWWGATPDKCPLAACPSAKGISVEGCPVFS